MSNSTVDLFVLYKLIKEISTPFNETDAFFLGLIDEKGKLIKKPKTREEKDAYGPFQRVVFNIKRILQRANLDKKYATYAGALLLMRENYSLTEQEIETEMLKEYAEVKKKKSFGQLLNDMSTTGSAVAGTGDDPVHWGKAKGRPKLLGKSINGLTFLKRKKKKKGD